MNAVEHALIQNAARGFKAAAGIHGTGGERQTLLVGNAERFTGFNFGLYHLAARNGRILQGNVVQRDAVFPDAAGADDDIADAQVAAHAAGIADA